MQMGNRLTLGIPGSGHISGEAAIAAMTSACCDTDLTDSRWEYIRPMLPKANKLGHPQSDRRRIIDAILLNGGIPWRLLPASFPPWKTVYHVFRAWGRGSTLALINATLAACERLSKGRKAQPSATIIDTQSVKSDWHSGEVGYDAGKKFKGRKRHTIFDTLGLVLALKVTPADCPLARRGQTPARGDRRPLPWLMRQRRLLRDYERTKAGAEAWIHLAMIRLQLRRLA